MNVFYLFIGSLNVAGDEGAVFLSVGDSHKVCDVVVLLLNLKGTVELNFRFFTIFLTFCVKIFMSFFRVLVAFLVRRGRDSATFAAG